MTFVRKICGHNVDEIDGRSTYVYCKNGFKFAKNKHQVENNLFLKMCPINFLLHFLALIYLDITF